MNHHRESHIDQLPLAVGTVACFGKLPGHGDFVRHNVSGPALEGLDEWLSESIHAMRTRGGPQFEQAMDGNGCIRFLFGPRESEFSIGLLFSSRDQSGRRYPFVIAAEVPSDGSRAQIPARSAELLSSLEKFARPVVNGGAPFTELIERLADIPAEQPPATAGDVFDSFLKQDAGTFWRRLFGSFDDSRKYLLLKNLLDIFGTERAGSMQEIAYGLVWPSPADESGAAACTSFWISLCEALTGDAFTTGAAFWQASSVVLFFQAPAVPAFRDMMLGRLDSESLFEIDRSGSENAALAALSIPPRHGACLERSDLTLAGWLDTVRRT